MATIWAKHTNASLIRKDNPFPTVCGYVCEHPCEARCRRRMVDDAVNICGIKRFACDHATGKTPPPCAPSTGKRIAVIGGGPGGLSAAYFLSLMGNSASARSNTSSDRINFRVI